MLAPVATRFVACCVATDNPGADYRDALMSMAPVQVLVAEALTEPAGIDELEAEF